MSKKEIKYGPNERMIIKDSKEQTDIYLSRKGVNEHDHIWYDKEEHRLGARFDRSFHLEPNDRSGCFLTTACVEYAGLPDDCKELQSMRAFRDTFVKSLPDGESILAEYYSTAPLIVQRIKALPNSTDVLSSLYSKLQAVVDLLDAQCALDAWNISQRTFEQLKEEYLH